MVGTEPIVYNPAESCFWRFLGPLEVPFAYSHHLEKTEGLLLSVALAGFGQDVHVLNSLARVMNNDKSQLHTSEALQIAACPPAVKLSRAEVFSKEN